MYLLWILKHVKHLKNRIGKKTEKSDFKKKWYENTKALRSLCSLSFSLASDQLLLEFFSIYLLILYYWKHTKLSLEQEELVY